MLVDHEESAARLQSASGEIRQFEDIVEDVVRKSQRRRDVSDAQADHDRARQRRRCEEDAEKLERGRPAADARCSEAGMLCAPPAGKEMVMLVNDGADCERDCHDREAQLLSQIKELKLENGAELAGPLHP